MTIIYSKNQYQRSESQGITIVNMESFEVSMKPTEVALVALMTIQASAALMSYFFPEKACLIQTGAMTASFLLFVKVKNVHNFHTQKHQTETIAHSGSLEAIAEEPAAQAKNQSLASTKIVKPEFRTRSFSLDERLDEMTSYLLKAKIWQIIPHPLYFKRQ